MVQAFSNRLDHERPPVEQHGSDGTLPSMEALHLVTNETRRAIVETLWEADDAPLRFTILRQRSGVEESARFNYHLQKLLGRCVRDAAPGYELTPRGERFIAAMCAVPSPDGQLE